jgi:hypothetical protein
MRKLLVHMMVITAMRGSAFGMARAILSATCSSADFLGPTGSCTRCSGEKQARFRGSTLTFVEDTGHTSYRFSGKPVTIKTGSAQCWRRSDPSS